MEIINNNVKTLFLVLIIMNFIIIITFFLNQKTTHESDNTQKEHGAEGKSFLIGRESTKTSIQVDTTRKWWESQRGFDYDLYERH